VGSSSFLFWEAALTAIDAQGLAAELTGSANSAVGGVAMEKMFGIGSPNN
jgi:hypothetical protein